MKQFDLQIVTPGGVLYDDKVVQISVRAIDGSLSVLADHIPMVTALKSAPCRVYVSEKDIREADCAGGILSVEKGKVHLLCTSFSFK